jgi:5-methylcytosine-specific restriction protein A
MSRTVKEWFGKTDDAMPPPSVRLRIYQNAGGVCHISGRKIQVGGGWERR